ncbi:DNA replication protein psf1 [Apophysomyces sp. BC1034]|nr:DNA replication protein psf1 [Apophysomyces sp. BC1015]KAG0178806.1 DNA replication protein psf1 [Apophysomyces sp. BC1021]KAG0188709.1 DNA replication protein psf1 [Apophysomyces sp. BC1034]
MSALGESSYKLAKEAKRTKDLLISPYNEDLVQSICRELRMLQISAERALHNVSQPNGQERGEVSRVTQIMLQHLAIKRNKRVLFAYHRQRVAKLKELSWDIGRQSEYQREINASLSVHEQRFLKDYGDMVNTYKQSFLEVDLGGNGGVGLEPPKDLFIEVRVIKDGGEINTEYGVLSLTKGDQYYARRTEVETFIKAGYLRHVV